MTNHFRETALITGASSGIGAAFARQLGCQGYDLVLVARRLDRLQGLANELKQCDPVCVEPLEADLACPEDLERVERRMAELENLSMLVNNAGFGTVGPFIDVPIDRHMEMIQVHVMATTRLCHAALPAMLRRKKGAIINVSSTAAFLTAHPIYSATKAYLNVFSQALQLQLNGTGIHVQALCPGLTHTEFHSGPEFQSPTTINQKAPRFMWMSADDVAATSLRALARDSVICVPGWMNRVLITFAQSALGPLMIRAMAASN